MLDTSPVSVLSQLNPLIRLLADIIECHWEQYFPLISYELPDGLGHVEGKLGRKKVVIENKCYKTPQFRKLHLEFAKVGQELDILHCVMFPHPSYSLPMFGCDIVAGPRKVSVAIVDLSPANRELTLSSEYHQALSQSPVLEFSESHGLPAWGDIFSDYCLFIRPTDPEEETQFLSRVVEFLKIHCQTAVDSQTVSSKQQMSNLAGQHYYCTKQQQNGKTRRVLEKAFGKKWANKYMTQVLFDLPTKDK
ncbi:phycocyanobilin:ferredoxin oxidoreductase [cyanobacterium endosymbiont of Rhopalodia gibberula]|uniref:phycocyanobilin:ferredoxin oxidoreductase n=1 Tax=cyanobacterium endosymbiont of Rhopalodia gibberula TaxID=1763363 RepID=UPI000DC6D279|nr:phycocyanobilin:ferredoxin oxidoreductase [cyanobacterium endosymbiont of Rhopalodia gibberula]BBA80181.1 phycocyanobilin:ferredoxin oxidoreductase [cyanobacterium endosymbiont of Rhopalodia gibberula]